MFHWYCSHDSTTRYLVVLAISTITCANLANRLARLSSRCPAHCRLRSHKPIRNTPGLHKARPLTFDAGALDDRNQSLRRAIVRQDFGTDSQPAKCVSPTSINVKLHTSTEMLHKTLVLPCCLRYTRLVTSAPTNVRHSSHSSAQQTAMCNARPQLHNFVATHHFHTVNFATPAPHSWRQQHRKCS